MAIRESKWLRHKGYLHITPQINVLNRRDEILSKVSNPSYVAKYAFFPLIHSAIKERKYKRIPNVEKRAHSYLDPKTNKVKQSMKMRPLHYATHMDALIFGYYGELLQTEYEKKLGAKPLVSESVIAYRSIPTEIEGKNKSTIHFAKEVFAEIKHRAVVGDCAALMFDIKSFFSRLNHSVLEKAWCSLIDKPSLPLDHKNVFRAATQFSYILLDDLRAKGVGKGRKLGYDEKKLHEIRKGGKFSFFSSAKDFRDHIKAGKLKIYKYPFRDKKTKQPVGIPQGLPISAILANLYLFSFDQEIHKELVDKLGCYYRRYSDDILILCKPENVNEVNKIVLQLISKSSLEISIEKTEEFLFKLVDVGKKGSRLLSIKKDKNGLEKTGVPLTYLGFEFYGYKTLIKSTNLAKFYRRMIYSVKSRSKRAMKIASTNSSVNPAVFRNQLYKLYTIQDLNTTKIYTKSKRLIKTEVGDYKLISKKNRKQLKSNYLSYVKRASIIMEQEEIINQVRKHRLIFNKAIKRHLKR